MSATARPPLEAVVDLDAYPLHDPTHPRYKALVADARAALDDVGCYSMADVFFAGVIADEAAMVHAVSGQAFRPGKAGTIYGQPADETLPEDHPRRFPMIREGAFVCADTLDPNSAMAAFYHDDRIMAFMRDAYGTDDIYHYADPLANLAVNAMWPGDEFFWHFDTNEMTVSVMLQDAEEGGVFEYIPNIRSPRDENYDAVARALKGDRAGVRTLKLKPGDVQLFKGRYTLHRVTRVGGSAPRYVSLPSYSSKPGQVGTVDRMIKSYGRASAVNYAREGISPDGLMP